MRQSNRLGWMVLWVATISSSACALMARPEPLTTLRLVMADVAWPANLALREVRADSALRSDRLLVVDGARLLQFPGVRLVDAPAVLWREKLQAQIARADQVDARHAISLHLTDFQIERRGQNGHGVKVSAYGELSCAEGGQIHALPGVNSEIDLTGLDPDAVSAALATAIGEVSTAILPAAALAASHCQSKAVTE